MNIVIFQCQPDGGDPASKLARIRVAASRAAAVRAELLVCPELMLSGYNIGAERIKHHAQTSDGEFAQAIAKIAKEHRLAIAYGYPEIDRGKIYNAARLVNSSGEFALNYRKAHLFGAYEREIFVPGDSSCAIADIGGWKVGLLICYDVEFPEATRELALQGAELIAVPTALMFPYGRVADLLIPARAYENQLYVAYANYCGSESDLRYCGKSTLAGPDGRIQLQANDDETLVIGELSRADLNASRELNTYLADRRPESYAALTNTARPHP